MSASVIIPNVVTELLYAEQKVLEAQSTPSFAFPYPIDEYSVLFGQSDAQWMFALRASAHGMERFNMTDDYMIRRDDPIDPGFNVHFDFFTAPSDRPWRVESICVLDGLAPLHTAQMGGDENYVGVFHASYKLAGYEEYHAELRRLKDLGLEMVAEYQNRYGRFSYWQLEPGLPYFKPRINTRDK